MTRGSLAHWVEWVLPWVVMGGNEKLGKPPNVRAVRRMVLGIDERIDGVNLGNWLVLEKWMDPKPFTRSAEDDEIWMHRTHVSSGPNGISPRNCAGTAKPTSPWRISVLSSVTESTSYAFPYRISSSATGPGIRAASRTSTARSAGRGRRD